MITKYSNNFYLYQKNKLLMDVNSESCLFDSKRKK